MIRRSTLAVRCCRWFCCPSVVGEASRQQHRLSHLFPRPPPCSCPCPCPRPRPCLHFLTPGNILKSPPIYITALISSWTSKGKANLRDWCKELLPKETWEIIPQDLDFVGEGLVHCAAEVEEVSPSKRSSQAENMPKSKTFQPILKEKTNLSKRKWDENNRDENAWGIVEPVHELRGFNFGSGCKGFFNNK